MQQAQKAEQLRKSQSTARRRSLELQMLRHNRMPTASRKSMSESELCADQPLPSARRRFLYVKCRLACRDCLGGCQRCVGITGPSHSRRKPLSGWWMTKSFQSATGVPPRESIAMRLWVYKCSGPVDQQSSTITFHESQSISNCRNSRPTVVIVQQASAVCCAKAHLARTSGIGLRGISARVEELRT